MNTIKKLVIYGDSISTTEFGGGGYQEKIKEKLALDTVDNYAVSGSGITAIAPNNLAELLDNPEKLPINADMVIIWHGTNDWCLSSPLGKIGDTSEKTFFGALDSSINKIRSCAPLANILYLTPLFRYQAPYGCECSGEAFECPNHLGHTLRDYYHAILESSQKLCFPILDMRTLTNFNLHNSSVYQPDNIHPSEKGYEVIARILINYIQLFYE